MTRALGFTGLGIVLVGGLAAAAACSSQQYYGTATITEQAGDPNARVDLDTGIYIPEGSVATAHIVFNSLTGGTMNGDLQSQNPSVLTVMHAPGDGQTYVFLGSQAGTTLVNILTDGVAVRAVAALVPAPSGASALEDGGPDASEAGASEAGPSEDAASDAGSETDATDAGTDDAGD